jgi:hypothetical protein
MATIPEPATEADPVKGPTDWTGEFPGDSRAGIVIARETHHSKKWDRDFEVLVLRDGDGEDTRVPCARAHLRQLLEEHNPVPGNGCAIAYFGTEGDDPTERYAMRWRSRRRAPRRASRMTSPSKPFEFDPNPLYSCDTGPGGTIKSWMAFDPDYGPQSQSQIDWHRREWGARFVKGWTVGLPLPDGKHGIRDKRRAKFQRNVRNIAEKPKSAALESPNNRNEVGGAYPSTNPGSVTDKCALCGCELPPNRGGRKRRDGARYCSPAHRQAAYRERQLELVA